MNEEWQANALPTEGAKPLRGRYIACDLLNVCDLSTRENESRRSEPFTSSPAVPYSWEFVGGKRIWCALSSPNVPID